MLLPFLRAELHEWVLPILQVSRPRVGEGGDRTQCCFAGISPSEATLCHLQGYVETAALELHGNAFELVIISRRLRHRAGTRYKRRGIDRDGHTANFVETEQRVVFGPTITSFVALRGWFCQAVCSPAPCHPHSTLAHRPPHHAARQAPYQCFGHRTPATWSTNRE